MGDRFVDHPIKGPGRGLVAIPDRDQPGARERPDGDLGGTRDDERRSRADQTDQCSAAAGGEDVVAAVVLDPAVGADSDSVRAACRQHLAGYKVPRRVVVVEDLPRSEIGKILRREVRDRLLAEG